MNSFLAFILKFIVGAYFTTLNQFTMTKLPSVNRSHNNDTILVSVMYLSNVRYLVNNSMSCVLFASKKVNIEFLGAINLLDKGMLVCIAYHCDTAV
jgi:hypothetical protein